MKYKGKAHKYGDNINTDEILPARHMVTHDPVELGKCCMEDLDKHFIRKVKKGDIVVAGRNFGCGSSREHAPIAIKASGVSCVIAESFARIFYRNAINIALPIVISAEASKDIKNGNKITVDTHKGIIRNVTRNKEYKSDVYPAFLDKIINKGGLMNYVKR